MATKHDVLHAQIGDSILDNGGGVNVGWRDEVCDVAMHKDVAGLQAEDGGFGHAAVGAAEPQDARRLAGRETGEESWILMRFVTGPGGV